MECKDKYNLGNIVYIVNYEDVKIKDGIVSIKRKYKEKKRPIYKIK
jgi:hypothetical protein